MDFSLLLACIFDEVVKIILKLVDYFLKPIAVRGWETRHLWSRGYKVSLEDLKVLAEVYNLPIHLLSLNFIHDFHRLNLNVGHLWVLLVPSVHLTGKLVLVQTVFISKPLNKLLLLIIQLRDRHVLFGYQIRHKLVFFCQNLAYDIISFRDHILHLVVSLVG